MVKDNILILPGWIDYADALNAQEKAVNLVTAGILESVTFILEHNHVYTAGIHYNGPFDNPKIIKTNRGGEVTYHGPGQVIMYPIINLEKHSMNVKDMVSAVQESVVSVLSEYGIMGQSRFGKETGVWVKSKKISSTGFHVSKSVTMHGIALNVNTDLSYFQMIQPCGFPPEIMTSMKLILGKEIDISEINEKLWKVWSERISVEDFSTIYSMNEFFKISEQLSETAPSGTG